MRQPFAKIYKKILRGGYNGMNIVCKNTNITIRKMNDCIDDYSLMANWLSDPIVLTYYEGRDNAFDLDKVIEHYQPRAKGEDYVVSCIIECGDKAVGYIQYYRADIDDPIMEKPEVGKKLAGRAFHNPYGIDLFIGETEYWNKGIGTSIIQLLVHYLFENNLADIIFIDPQTWNERAIKCYEKCGFKPIAILEKNELHEGSYRDNLLMAIYKGTSNDKSEIL